MNMQVNPPTLDFWTVAFLEALTKQTNGCFTTDPQLVLDQSHRRYKKQQRSAQSMVKAVQVQGSKIGFSDDDSQFHAQRDADRDEDSMEDEPTKAFMVATPQPSSRTHGRREHGSKGSSVKARISPATRTRSRFKGSASTLNRRAVKARQKKAGLMPSKRKRDTTQETSAPSSPGSASTTPGISLALAGALDGERPNVTATTHTPEPTDFEIYCTTFRRYLVGEMCTVCLLHPNSLQYRPAIVAYCLVLATMVRVKCVAQSCPCCRIWCCPTTPDRI